MITISEYQRQPIGVFGLGKAGEAAVAALVAGGAEVWAWDDTTVSIEKIGLRFGSQVRPRPIDAWPWERLRALVLSPGVPLTHPAPHGVVNLAVQHNVPVLGEVELLARACRQAHIIGITGTNGKSTTTTLIGHILQHCGKRAEVGGNLGTPALALEPLGANGHYVLELSSYQLDLVKTVRFNVAVWLNITPDHLDRHGDMTGYIKAKEHIFKHQQPGDMAIIGIDDEYSKTMMTRGLWLAASKAKIVPVSVREKMAKGVYVENGMLHDTYFSGGAQYDVSGITTLTGRHNWQNAACAYAAARAVGIPGHETYAAMQSFAGLRHRLQLVATINGVRFINDSKATNADATSNALAAYDTIYWIAGGKPKAGGIGSLTEYFPRVAQAFLIGEAEAEFAATLEGKVTYTCCGTLDIALQQAAALAFREGKENAVVLLSPACASFDQFKNFEQRGDVFCELVNGLQETKRHAS